METLSEATSFDHLSLILLGALDQGYLTNSQMSDEAGASYLPIVTEREHVRQLQEWTLSQEEGLTIEEYRHRL